MSDEARKILEAAGFTIKQYEDWITAKKPAITDPGADWYGIEAAHAEIAELEVPPPDDSAGTAESVLGEFPDIAGPTGGTDAEKAEFDAARRLMEAAQEAILDARRDADDDIEENEEDTQAFVDFYTEYGDMSEAQVREELNTVVDRALTNELIGAADFRAQLDYNVAWINQGDFGIFGVLTDEDVLDIANHATMMFPEVTYDMLVYKGVNSEQMSDDEKLIAGTKRFLGGKNTLTESIVRDWGTLNDRYMSMEDMDAYRLFNAVDGQLTFQQSRSLMTSSQSAGLNTDMAWRVYSIALDLGILAADPFAGRTTTPPLLAGDPATFGQEDSGGTVKNRPAGEERMPTEPAVQTVADPRWYQPSTTLTNLGSGDLAAMKRGTGLTPSTLWPMFNAGVKKWNSEIVAMLALTSSDLAERMWNDPHSLTGAEWLEIDRAIGGYDRWLGVPGVGAQAEFIADRLAGTNQVVHVDSAGAMNAARDLASSWNMPGLSDGMLRQIATGQAANLQASVKASLGNPFQPGLGGPVSVEMPSDLSAAMRALRGTTEYATLFKNMRSGESEEDYATRFDASVMRFMNDSDPVLARAGMRSGDPKTVGQSALLSGKALGNSSFMERLTSLGNAYRRAT